MMIIHRAYKTQLDPNARQRHFFRVCSGIARFIYNWALADRIAAYKEDGTSINMYEQKRRFNALKKEEYPWIMDAPYTVLAQAFRDVDSAYQHFFRRVKAGNEKPGFPKWRSKSSSRRFTVRGNIHVEPRRIKLPRIDWIRLKERDYLPPEQDVDILSATVSERAGKWFISLQAREEIELPDAPGGPPLGIDFGIHQLAVFSNGATFENPKALVAAERKLKRLNKELARRKKGSSNWHKTKRKLQRQHYKIACIRAHAQHHVSRQATAEHKPSTIVLEDLNVAGMLQNRHLSKAISDVGFAELRRQIEYKALWNNIEVILADRWFPSSKTCHACGAKKPLLKLSERRFVCEECGTVIDRDLNAALNLAAYDRTVKPTGIACGASVNQCTTGKQEAQ